MRNRRLALVVLVAMLAVACGGEGDGGDGTGTPEPLVSVTAGATAVDLITAQSVLPIGASEFTFGLVSKDGQLITAGAPEVWLQRADGQVRGPFDAIWHEFTGYEATHDHSPRTELPGFFAAPVDIDQPGRWTVVAAAGTGDARVAGTGFVQVSDEVPVKVGDEALRTPTPVATEEADLKKICTRTPPDDLHSISLDDALANGKPTVVNFGTPALCGSRMCGPVVDEVILAAQRIGQERANFIHVEVYPGNDPSKLAPSFQEWGFSSEPWTIVIDAEGTITAAFEGPVAAPQIEDALSPLLQ